MSLFREFRVETLETEIIAQYFEIDVQSARSSQHRITNLKYEQYSNTAVTSNTFVMKDGLILFFETG